jgi:anti-anti-sigma factor
MSEQSNQIVVLRLAGPRLAHTECDIVKEAFNQHIRAGEVRLVLDFSDVDFIDSTMIGTLVAGIRRVNSFQGKVVVCNLAPPLERLLAILKLEKLFTVCTTLDEAKAKMA